MPGDDVPGADLPGRVTRVSHALVPHEGRPRTLLIGDGIGAIAPLVGVVERLLAVSHPNSATPDAINATAMHSSGANAATATAAHKSSATDGAPTVGAGRWRPLVMLGSDIPFPFRTRPSTIIVPGIPTWVLACMPLLEDWGVASRLASNADFPGCFEGSVITLADTWLQTLDPDDLAHVEILACGPPSMLAESATLAQRYGVPYQSTEP